MASRYYCNVQLTADPEMGRYGYVLAESEEEARDIFVAYLGEYESESIDRYNLDTLTVELYVGDPL